MEFQYPNTPTSSHNTNLKKKLDFNDKLDDIMFITSYHRRQHVTLPLTHYGNLIDKTEGLIL